MSVLIQDWVKQTIPPQYQTENLLILINTIDELIIRDKEKIIKDCNSPYPLSSEEKFFFINNEIHILFKWIYKDVLIGVKHIGETALVINTLSLQYNTTCMLMISINDFIFTSVHLLDFRSIIANLTIRIENIVRKISDQLLSKPDIDNSPIMTSQPNPLIKKNQAQIKPKGFTVPSFGNTIPKNNFIGKLEENFEITDNEKDDEVNNVLNSEDEKPIDLFTDSVSMNQEVILPKLPKIPKMDVGSIRYSSKE